MGLVYKTDTQTYEQNAHNKGIFGICLNVVHSQRDQVFMLPLV